MQLCQLKRRGLIPLLRSAGVAWSVVARAEQPKRPTIGYLGATTAASERPRTDAFVQRLRELGWIEGETVEIQYRWGESRAELFPSSCGGACPASGPAEKPKG